MDKQEQTDQDRCRGHVLFAKSCSPCPLPVWPVITERLGLSADYRWPCGDPDNLLSNHMMAALAPRATGSSTVNPQNNRTFKTSSSQHRSRDRRRLQVSFLSTDGKSSPGNVSYSGFYSPLCKTESDLLVLLYNDHMTMMMMIIIVRRWKMRIKIKMTQPHCS